MAEQHALSFLALDGWGDLAFAAQSLQIVFDFMRLMTWLFGSSVVIAQFFQPSRG
jgi:hypothetical protein